MTKHMHEGNWSPFDPQWYQQAFDKSISTADQLDRQDELLKEGYTLPDADGSRSSAFRRDAILNNSFDENILRESLKDIYFNNSHRLIASNHDNVGFFSWSGSMSDMSLIENTGMAEFKIPTDTFIGPKERDMYKLSQYYRQWISTTDLLNNWKTFKWHCLLFINQKVYSEFIFRIDDHETTIRFPYNQVWVKNNVPVYIYKFGTNAQCRIKISRELVLNQWRWRVPTEYITDQQVCNNRNIIVAFNKIGDPSLRSDGHTKVEVLGDNLEFLTIEDGFIDLSNISNFNKIYIQSESREWLWMSIFVPKFLQEYPMLLPVDTIYRPYESDIHPVRIEQNGVVKGANIDPENPTKVYVDVNDGAATYDDKWQHMIRPIVLSDAFNPSTPDEVYADLSATLEDLKNTTVRLADSISEFRTYMKFPGDTSDIMVRIDHMTGIVRDLKDLYNMFLDSRRIPHNPEYDSQCDKYLVAVEDIKKTGAKSEWFAKRSNNSEENFWFLVSPLVYIPQKLVEDYEYIRTMSSIGRLRNLWLEGGFYTGKIRYRRPIDVLDFWTFEYYHDEQVWRPYPLKIDYHFPDVYLPTDVDGSIPTTGRIFKTFFFYSDTMNVLDPVGEMKSATPSWDTDIEEYHIDQQAVYRDIFMEKFYWMGIQAIYNGLLMTESRWEIIEYVVNNPSYERFNQLFLQTMDPYFKLGLATYMKSSNFEFPFDDVISKLKESIGNKFLGYQKITNLEVYLNNSWVPSYFEYAVKILDNWAWEKHIVKRPSSSLAVDRLLPTITDIQTDLHQSSTSLLSEIKLIQEILAKWTYGLKTEPIESLVDKVNEMYGVIDDLMEFVSALDSEIYSIDDINHISKAIDEHSEMLENVKIGFENINRDVVRNNIWMSKREHLQLIPPYMEVLPEHILILSRLASNFDVEKFMAVVNDLRGYLEYPKSDSDSLIGHINEFDSPWPESVKICRNNLFVASSTLAGTYEPTKAYSDDEITELVTCVQDTHKCIDELRQAILTFWQETDRQPDSKITDRLDYSESVLDGIVGDVHKYIEARTLTTEVVNSIMRAAYRVKSFSQSPAEEKCQTDMENSLSQMMIALSYIAGVNNRDEATTALSAAKEAYLSWSSLLYEEENLFKKLMSLSTAPIAFVETMEGYKSKLVMICDYVNTITTRIGEPQSPTYSDVYELDKSYLSCGGIANAAGEIIFAPNLGVYKAIEVDDNGTITWIDAFINGRKTTFRDPCETDPDEPARVYDTITTGKGIGCAIEALESNLTMIINDRAVEGFIEKIKGYAHKVELNIVSYNRAKNSELYNIFDVMHSMNTEWDGWDDNKKSHLSANTVRLLDDLFRTASNLKEELSDFMDDRTSIDVGYILDVCHSVEKKTYLYAEKTGKLDQTFFYYDNNVRQAYNTLNRFYGNGITWSDGRELISILGDLRSVMMSYLYDVIDKLGDVEDDLVLIDGNHNLLIGLIDRTQEKIQAVPNDLVGAKLTLRKITADCDKIKSQFRIDEWYRVDTVRVAKDNGGYRVGDIVKIIPEMPTAAQIDDTMNDVIMNDILYFQITRVSDGHPSELRPLLDYALPYSIWGIRQTDTIVGNGIGLVLDIYTSPITIDDSTLYRPEGLPDKAPKFGQNDLLKFQFENIHDLDIGYEIYCGGEQIGDYIKRHDTISGGTDSIYLNANKVIQLQNKSVSIPEENHITYRLDNITVKDPGAGYSVGQDIVVDTESSVLRLKVSELTDDPFKGIKTLEPLTTGNFQDVDPSCRGAKVITDSMNNIDDEYNNGYYDHLTDTGITKPATLSYDRDEFTFVSRRFDDLPIGDRNATFGYPDIDGESSGDPDTPGLYLGNRIDNSQHPLEDPHRYNGIINVIPPSDPSIPVDRRFPTGHSPIGEYQLIQTQRIHSSENETNDRVTKKFENSVVNSAMIVGDLTVEDYTNLPKHTIEWPEGKIGKSVIVERDSSNGGHRMIYRIRTFVAAGFFVYDTPEIADISWNIFNVNWMSTDWHPDVPGMKTRYPSVDWENSPSYRKIQREISDGKHEAMVQTAEVGNSTYIHDLSIDDISVFNYTTKEWEDLSDASRWDLDVHHNPETGEFGFTLKFIADVHNGSILVKEIPYDRVKFIWDENGDGYKDPIPPEMDRSTVQSIWDLDGAGYVDPEDGEMKYLKVRTIWETDGEGYVEPKEELWTTVPVESDDAIPYSYDMRLYLNKERDNQIRNAGLKKNAILDIDASMTSEVNIPAINSYVDVGKTLRIRKVFPYTQKETFTIGRSDKGDPLGYEMDFNVAPYMHYKNELHLEDVTIYNKTAGRWENILDPRLFEVRFKDPRCNGHGTEINTTINQILVSEGGQGFVDGNTWAYNAEYGTHIFGQITSDYRGDCHLLTFKALHIVDPPTEEICTLEFDVYQFENQTEDQKASIIVEFHTEQADVWADGYIHNVTNPLAPLPEEFKIICQYDLDGPAEYDVIIDKHLHTWTFVDPEWRVSPTFHIPDKNIPKDRLYILTEYGRYPLANPSTGKPTMVVEQTGSGTDVTYLSLYRRYERIRIVETPYPMRSVYAQRRVPASGYIDLAGKINKPLNKKYFEFWMNGKLLGDEVTIITPTKLFLHGLTSLRNFEIIEINRDPNEYFSDGFLLVSQTPIGRPYARWDYRTYLDDALDGTLDGDNYSLAEQEYLLSPVWRQVQAEHPEFKNYPPNVDTDIDILIKSNPEDYPIDHLSDPSYQFLVVDQPTLEGRPIVELTLGFGLFGLAPISNRMISNILNEVWADEIENNPHFPEHTAISDDEWYGTTTKMYDEYGMLVHSIDDAAYKVIDPNTLKINTSTKLSQITRNVKKYDLD